LFICHLPGTLFADLVRVGTVVKRIRAADLANRAEERVSALRSKGGSGRRSFSGHWFLAISKLQFIWVCLSTLQGLNGWAFSKTPNLSNPIDDDFAALGLVGRANLVATFVWVYPSALEGLNGWAFSKTPKLSDPIDNDFAALGLVGRANLVATFVWV
jgi:hypothetical protein